jgi:uncharacterized membrane protein
MMIPREVPDEFCSDSMSCGSMCEQQIERHWYDFHRVSLLAPFLNLAMSAAFYCHLDLEMG